MDWNAIAGKTDWGSFQFSHTIPTESNSGLMTLVLMAYDYHSKTTGLTLTDILEPEYVKYWNQLELAIRPSRMNKSTDWLMNEMVHKGTALTTAFVSMRVWPWTSSRTPKTPGATSCGQSSIPATISGTTIPITFWPPPGARPTSKAAEVFMDFLHSPPMQAMALVHGFRPDDLTSVNIKAADSPFVKYQDAGFLINPTQSCDSPSPEVLEKLQSEWDRWRRQHP